MRRLTLALLAALAPGLAFADTLSVSMNSATRVTLSAPASDVVVGNPAIADVTVADRRHLLVVGKGFGSTSLMVLGEGGKVIMNRMVMVPMPQFGRVTMINGDKVQGYACAPQCFATDGETGSDPQSAAALKGGSPASTVTSVGPEPR